MMRKEAMKLALEALDGIYRYGLDTLSGRSDGPDDRDWQRAGVNEMTKRARFGITALKALAEQPAQPAQQEPWVGLTENELEDIWERHHTSLGGWDYGGDDVMYYRHFEPAVADIEAKLKEKNA